MALTMNIGKKLIGEGQPVFVIAEVGINHNGNKQTALELIDKAKWAGASAVKLQTYITEKRVPKDSPIFGILKQCELSFDVQKELFAYANKIGIQIFSTPFDDESVDFLDSIGSSCYKIASFDLVNTKLLKAVAKKGKPVIASRGMATKVELDRAVALLQEANVPIALLHCVSAYPVNQIEHLNLSTINALKKDYNCVAGYSDHTLGIEAPVYAIAAGATIIEKHFTLSSKAQGPDHALSTEPAQMKEMIEKMERIRVMMGTPAQGPVAAEKDILQYRRPS